MSFEQDIIDRTNYKLANMLKTAEKDGEEADLQPTWFESLANSAPVSGMLDFLDQSGFSSAAETGQQSLGENLGNFLNDVVPDSNVAAANRLAQDQDDWKQDKEFRAIRQSNRAEKARELDAQDRYNRVNNLLSNGYRSEGGLQDLADLLGLKSTADYAMNPADVNLSNPQSFLSGIRDSMNKTDLSEGYSQLKRRGLDAIADIKNQTSDMKQGLLDYLRDANSVISNNIQNIPEALQSVFNPLVQPIMDTYDISDNVVKNIYNSMARGAEHMLTPEYRRRQLAERQEALQAESDRRKGNNITRAIEKGQQDVNSTISTIKGIAPIIGKDVSNKLRRKGMDIRQGINEYNQGIANKFNTDFSNLQDILRESTENNAISNIGSWLGNLIYNPD